MKSIFQTTIRSISLCLLLCYANSIYSQWTGSPNTSTKVCTAPSNQRNIFSVADGSGGSIIAWEDSRNGNSDIYIDNISSNGMLLWSAPNSYLGIAVCTATGTQYIEDLINDASGNIFIVWSDRRNTVNGDDIYIQKFNSNGVAQWTVNGMPVVTATKDQNGSRIVSDGAGGILVTWGDGRNNPDFGSYVQRLNSNGLPLWAVNGIPVYGSYIRNGATDIIPDGSGGIIIALLDGRNNTLDINGNFTNIDIYAQRISANGALLWGTTGVPVCTQTSNQNEQNWNIVTDGSGGAIIYWHDYRNDPTNGFGYPNNSNGDIYAQRINSSGTTQWALNGVAISTDAQDVNDIKVVSDGQGGAVAMWQDFLYNYTTFQVTSLTIKTQRTNASGANLLTVNGINLSNLLSFPVIDLTIDNVGGVIYTWNTKIGSPPTSYRVVAQRLNLATSTLSWPASGVLICTNSNGVYTPSISNTAPGESIIAWSDSRNNTTTYEDVYAAKLYSDGTLPILWGNISGILKGNDAVINWETMQELNTKVFEVERGYNGSEFERIASIKAAGNSVSISKYEITDKDVLKYSGKSLYYRIKQVDLDGIFSFSKVVRLNIPKEHFELKLLQNPVVSLARLSYFSPTMGDALLRLTDMNGKIKFQKQIKVIKGANQLQVDISKLVAGIYNISIEQNDSKLVVQCLK